MRAMDAKTAMSYSSDSLLGNRYSSRAVEYVIVMLDYIAAAVGFVCEFQESWKDTETSRDSGTIFILDDKNMSYTNSKVIFKSIDVISVVKLLRT
jgi:hypothetical protein